MAELSENDFVAFTNLLQKPTITAACSENCGCNEVCGCKKDSCCEYKCSCDGKGSATSIDADVLRDDERYKEIVRNFSPENIRTISDFQALTRRIKAHYGGEAE
jgi:hypothetical protein